jgi:hypothetical protein
MRFYGTKLFFYRFMEKRKKKKKILAINFLQDIHWKVNEISGCSQKRQVNHNSDAHYGKKKKNQ